ncbi:MAG: fructose-bisphosphate aldolase [Candidatus Aenigmatarchaeota archaeon]
MIFESKENKLKKVLKDGKALVLAFDHIVEHGPHEYEGIDISPQRIGKIAVEGKVDALIVHIGTARIIRKIYPKLPLIIKLTARNNLIPDEMQIQEVVTKVKEVKDLNVIGIAYTIYFGSEFEPQMLKNFSEIKEEAKKYSLPIFGFAYPRSKKFESKYHPIAIRYAARLGAEIGFDVIKTYYTGDKESFSKVVKDCFVPILIAGGPKIEEEKEFLKTVEEVMSIGASGIVVGRNVWERKDEEALHILEELRRIIHK